MGALGIKPAAGAEILIFKAFPGLVGRSNLRKWIQRIALRLLGRSNAPISVGKESIKNQKNNKNSNFLFSGKFFIVETRWTRPSTEAEFSATKITKVLGAEIELKHTSHKK